jgi:hypothetical protein
VTLDGEDIEAIAQRTAGIILEQLGTAKPAEWLTVQQLASQLGLSTDYIYRHAQELGGQRIGGGTQPPWRFPPKPPFATAPTTPPRAPARKRRPTGSVPLLPVRG